MLDLLGLEIISTNETEEAELDNNASSIDEIQEVTDSTAGDLSNTQVEQSNVAIFTVESFDLNETSDPQNQDNMEGTSTVTETEPLNLSLDETASGDVSYVESEVEIEFVDANNNSSPNHVCKGCNKHFANKSNLARHSKIHTGNMLECNVCTKAYPTYYDLKRHTESVHGGRRFVCEHDDCNKVFKSAVGLNNHNKEHQGQFSYLCQYCGKGFNLKQFSFLF